MPEEARTSETVARPPVHFVPITLSYTKLALGQPPIVVDNEQRHMMFTNFSYRAMLQELGIKLGQTDNGEDNLKDTISEATSTIDEDPIRRSSVMIWAALINEDNSLTVDDVMKMVDISQFQELMLAVVRSMAYFVHGPLGHEEADKAVEESRDKMAEQQKALEEAGADADDGVEKNA